MFVSTHGPFRRASVMWREAPTQKAALPSCLEGRRSRCRPQSDTLTCDPKRLRLKSEEGEPNRSSVTGSLFLFVKCERHCFSLKVVTAPFNARKCRLFQNKAGLRMRTRATNRAILIPDSIFTLGTLNGAGGASCERCRATD